MYSMRSLLFIHVSLPVQCHKRQCLTYVRSPFYVHDYFVKFLTFYILRYSTHLLKENFDFVRMAYLLSS